MKRILAIAALCLFGSLPAKATTYYIDLSTIAQDGIDFGGGYSGAGPMFSAIAANPGDVFDFGSVTLTQVLDSHTAARSRWYNNLTREWVTPYIIYSPSVSVSYDPLVRAYSTSGPSGYDQGLNGPPTLRSYTIDLEFVIPDDAHSIQIGWNNSNGVYTAPQVAAVPEPSTWLMMLLGFAALAGLLQLKNAQRRIEIDRERLACR